LNNEENSIGRWISVLYRHRQNYISKKLSQHNIGIGQYIIILTLFTNCGINQEELSNLLKIDKGSIAKSIKKLENEKYVERKINSNDKRAYKLFLTKKAIKILPALKNAAKEWENEITSDFSDKEKDSIRQLLNKMIKKIQK